MKITLVDWQQDSDLKGFPVKFCPKCDQPMEVLSIRRMLNGEGDTDITFCCVACFDKLIVKHTATSD